MSAALAVAALVSCDQANPGPESRMTCAPTG
jgi:hypothetical protein